MRLESPRLESSRLVLRPWTHDPDELDRLADLYSRPSLVRFLGVVREPVGRMVDDWAQHMAADPRQFIAAIEVRKTGLIAGTVLYNLLPGEHHMEVGWHLHPDSEGHGYATEAGHMVIERGFALGVPEVFALVVPKNIRSQRVCRRLGMAHLGRTTRYHDTEYELFHVVSRRLRPKSVARTPQRARS